MPSEVGLEKTDIMFGLLALSEAPAVPEAAWLDDEEKSRFDAMAGPIRPREFLGGRFLAKSMAGRILGIEASAVRIEVERGGRPFIPHPHELNIGLSHTREYAACALSRMRIGLDIEELGCKNGLERVESYAFSSCERDSLACLTGEDRERRFFRMWTLKEAYLKRLGRGVESIRRAPSFPIDDEEQIMAIGGEPCCYMSFELGDSLVGALAFDTPLEADSSCEARILIDPRYAPSADEALRVCSLFLYDAELIPRSPHHRPAL
jgi:4'-phosphopantetheinyl transferase